MTPQKPRLCLASYSIIFDPPTGALQPRRNPLLPSYLDIHIYIEREIYVSSICCSCHFYCGHLYLCIVINPQVVEHCLHFKQCTAVLGHSAQVLACFFYGVHLYLAMSHGYLLFICQHRGKKSNFLNFIRKAHHITCLSSTQGNMLCHCENFQQILRMKDASLACHMFKETFSVTIANCRKFYWKFSPVVLREY